MTRVRAQQEFDGVDLPCCGVCPVERAHSTQSTTIPPTATAASYWDADTRSVVDDFAQAGGAAKFYQELVSAWVKVMNADRFDLDAAARVAAATAAATTTDGLDSKWGTGQVGPSLSPLPPCLPPPPRPRGFAR